MSTRVSAVRSASKPASKPASNKFAPLAASRRLPAELLIQIRTFDRRTLREVGARRRPVSASSARRAPSKGACRPAPPAVPLPASGPLRRMPAELQLQILRFDRRSLRHVVVTRCRVQPVPAKATTATPASVAKAAAPVAAKNLKRACSPQEDLLASIAFAAAARVNRPASACFVKPLLPPVSPAVAVVSKAKVTQPKAVSPGPLRCMPIELQRELRAFDRRRLRRVSTRVSGLAVTNVYAPAAVLAVAKAAICKTPANSPAVAAKATISVSKTPLVPVKVSASAVPAVAPSPPCRRMPLELLVQIRTFDRRSLRHVPPRVSYAKKSVAKVVAKAVSVAAPSAPVTRPLPACPVVRVPAGSAPATSALVTVQFQCETAQGVSPVGQTVSFRIQLPASSA